MNGGDALKQKKITIIALTSGIVCALCMALFMWSVQKQATEAHVQMLARYGGEQVEACVAVRDIAAGERLDASTLETRLWVASLLPDSAICDSKEAIGQIATTSIMKGEVIVAKRFQKTDSELDIPSGFQAVSVPVKTVQAVGGTVRSGMRVDVYATGDTTTTVLATNILVLDTSMDETDSLVSSGNGWITLAIEPKRVQEIVAAANKTSLYFTVPGEQTSFQESAQEPTQDQASSTSKESSQSTTADKSASDKQTASTQDRPSTRISESSERGR